jgi:hypothetical protein
MQSTAEDMRRDDSRDITPPCQVIPLYTIFPYKDHICPDALVCEYSQLCDNGKRCVDAHSDK